MDNDLVRGILNLVNKPAFDRMKARIESDLPKKVQGSLIVKGKLK